MLLVLFFCDNVVRFVLFNSELLKKCDWERRVSVVSDWGFEGFIYD